MEKNMLITVGFTLTNECIRRVFYIKQISLNIKQYDSNCKKSLRVAAIQIHLLHDFFPISGNTSASRNGSTITLSFNFYFIILNFLFFPISSPFLSLSLLFLLLGFLLFLLNTTAAASVLPRLTTSAAAPPPTTKSSRRLTAAAAAAQLPWPMSCSLIYTLQYFLYLPAAVPSLCSVSF